MRDFVSTFESIFDECRLSPRSCRSDNRVATGRKRPFAVVQKCLFGCHLSDRDPLARSFLVSRKKVSWRVRCLGYLLTRQQLPCLASESLPMHFSTKNTRVPVGIVVLTLLALFASEPLVATSDSIIAQSEQSIVIQGTAQRIKPGTLLI